jgi:predicted dehydrogenase
MDLGVHCLELVEDILGESITEIKGYLTTKTFCYEVEDSAVVIFKTAGGVLGHMDCNFSIPDKASESKLEIYGDKGYIICRGTLAQEDGGTLEHLYCPQGDYEAAQNRTTDDPICYHGNKENNMYRRQLAAFSALVKSGKPDYTLAERAVHVQELVDALYAQNN